MDEEYTRFNEAKFGNLRAAFKKDGTITAGNASSLNDGACALVMMTAERAKELGVTPLARVRGYADAATQVTPSKKAQFLLFSANRLPNRSRIRHSKGFEVGRCFQGRCKQPFST